MSTPKPKPAVKKPSPVKGGASTAAPKVKKKPVASVPKQKCAQERYARFAEEYIIDLNGAQAAIRAGYAPKSAHVTATNLLKIPSIKAHIDRLRAERAKETKITAEKVLQRWWEIATADANELTQFRRVCCRHCHGHQHQYQYRDMAEFNEAVASYMAAAKAAKAAKVDMPYDAPSNAGGFGYMSNNPPHSGCPKCEGEGQGEPFFHDTRKLSSQAKLIYRGTKVTKNGIEVMTADQDAALKIVTQHLGMLDPKLTLKGDPENPITLLLQAIGKRSSLPVVRTPRDDDGAETP